MRSSVVQALLLIDLQVGILNGPPAVHDVTTLLRNVGRLLDGARRAGAEIVYVQHDGPPGHRAAIGSPGWSIHPDVLPGAGELVLHKAECDAFLGTPLDEELRKRGVEHLFVAGCMTPFCIDTSCRRAFSLGYAVTLVADAHSTSDSAGLSAAQIIAHHNDVLDGFGCAPRGGRDILVRATDAISFAASSASSDMKRL
jgi:nicotinamidase-related amidase